MMTRIQVVEDERIVAEDIQRSLQYMGYDSSAVSSGEEAIQKAEKDNPDLVLMDIILKGDMDGIEAAEQICSQFDIPVVYLTAHADEKNLQRAKVTEPYGYILKPFEDKELHTTIETALYKHKMEKKVKENEQWLATTLKSIGDGVIATDTQGLITFMNPVAESLTGRTQEEAIEKPLGEVFYIVDEETRQRCKDPFEKIMKTDGVADLANNTVLIAKDGTERSITDSGAPICSNDHHVLGTVLVFRDITEKRKMEEDLLALKTEKMESLSILAGGIAHDFDNILTAALGNIALAKMHTTVKDNIFGILTEAENVLVKAKSLTQQQLIFSKEAITEKERDGLMGANERILVMDDDESILNITRDVLEHLGYQAAFARNGREAIALYEKALKAGLPFDTVILDLTIQGGLGGKETVAELLKIDPDVKAIVSSGYSDDPVVIDFRKYGFCGAMTKPYSIEELSTTLYEVIYTSK